MNNMAKSGIRVLVPNMLAYYGGVRRLLGEGLPHLQRVDGLKLEYAELCQNETDLNEMAKGGVTVNRDLGIPGRGVLSYRQGTKRIVDLIRSLPRIARLLWQLSRVVHQYELIYVHGYRELSIVQAARLLSRRNWRSVVVWHCHGLSDGRPPPLAAFLANRCGKVIAISEDTARRLCEIGVDASHIDVVYDAVDVDKIEARAKETISTLPRRRPGKFVILLPCASIRIGKGVHLAVSALENLPATCHLWVTGDPTDPVSKSYKNRLDTIMSWKGLNDRVHFIGYRSDIYSVMALSDVVVVPSVCREAFGLVAAEAMALGKPIVVSNRGGLPEVVGSHENGWFFDPNNPNTLAACLLDILLDREGAERRGSNGRKHVERTFRYDNWAENVRRVFLSVHIQSSGKRG